MTNPNIDSFYYHIASTTDFNPSLTSNYLPSAFSSEGFIHLCTLDQLRGVVDRYFDTTDGFVVLSIKKQMIEDKLKWEGDKELFPHLYQAIELEWILDKKPLSEFLKENY